MTSRSSWATGLVVAGCLWLVAVVFLLSGTVRTTGGACGSVLAPSGNDDGRTGAACAEARTARTNAVLVAGPTAAALLLGGVALRRSARRQSSSAASTS